MVNSYTSRFVLPLVGICLFGALPAAAVTLQPSAMTVTVPGTSAPVALDPGAPMSFTDDVFLNSLTFGTRTFTGTDNFRAASDFTVLSGRNQVNVEWGDDDDGSDGDDTPLVKAGITNTTNAEALGPADQDFALLQVFNSLSLSEMTDGEAGSAHSYRVLFENGITDNDAGVDDIPEIVFFERGRNDTFELLLILGGTFDDPILSDAITVSSESFASPGLNVDTIEISGSQALGVGGFDLNDWGIPVGASVFGFEFRGSGADLSGIFASGLSDQFVPPLPPSVVPLPAGVLLLLTALGGFRVLRRRQA
ncbi:MAG: exosortase-dependent surface protein XDP2 [Pseudomonadota bacterium]